MNDKLLQQLREVNLPDEILEEIEGKPIETDVIEVEVDEDPESDGEEEEVSSEIREAIAVAANSSPDIRKFRTCGKYLDDEIKVVAAALRTRVALYRVADSLHCSYQRIKNMINATPILKELLLEQKDREREETEEAVDDCIKARVPAVVMWKAAKIMPEKYGEQINIDNEDDSRIVIGAIPEEDVVAADKIVQEMADKIPDVGRTLLDDLKTGDAATDGEIAVEAAAAGVGVSSEPLNRAPAAPAVNPPTGDANFREFIPGSQISPAPDAMQENDGGLGLGGGYDDFGSDSWI